MIASDTVKSIALIHFSEVMETEHINKSPSYFICSQISVRSSVLADW